MHIKHISSTLCGFGTGYFSLQHILINHSKTTQITNDEYLNNSNLRNKILQRHNTMKNILNVNMDHVKRKL